MKINKNSSFYPEDMVPYSIVRDHLRYDYGDAEELVKSYVASACDYMETLSDRVFCSSTPSPHELTSAAYDSNVAPLEATVTVYLDKKDLDRVQQLRNVTGNWTVTSQDYYHETGAWLPLAGQEQIEAVEAADAILGVSDDPATTEIDETVIAELAVLAVDFQQGALGAGMADAFIFTDTYPVEIDWTEMDTPSDIHSRDKQVYRIVLTGGDNVKDLPRQFRQAMLLLVGHYDSQREAEYIGGLTSEVKEGVHRLMATVKQY